MRKASQDITPVVILNHTIALNFVKYHNINFKKLDICWFFYHFETRLEVEVVKDKYLYQRGR